jgi:ubiquinone/menaquinone biosynthesis C-methylase UbiE
MRDKMSNQTSNDQAFIFNHRAVSFDKLQWVKDQDFLGNIFLSIHNFVDNYHKSGNKVKKILDVGTGTGEVIKYFVDRYMNEQQILVETTFVGIDVSQEMLKIAKQKLKYYPNVEFINNSIINHNLDYQSFDLIICRNSFHHFEAPDQALQEMKKLLRPSGKIFIIEGVAPDSKTLLKWKEILLLRDTGRNSSILLSLENIKPYFENNFCITTEISELTPVTILLSNWLNNALITNDLRFEIISRVDKLSKDETFSHKFGLVSTKKNPSWCKDYQFKKKSALIQISI